jgi:hypothetical protein
MFLIPYVSYNLIFSIIVRIHNFYSRLSFQLMTVKDLRRLEKKWEHNETVHQLFIDFKKAYDLVRKEALYNILIELINFKFIVHLVGCFIKKCDLNMLQHNTNNM